MMREITSRVRSAEQESLFRASEQLKTVATAVEPTEAWSMQARQAIRDSTMAVESRLDSVYHREGFGEEIAREEPRLIPALDRLEALLAKLLLEFWEARRLKAGSPTNLAPVLSELAIQMRHVADNEFDLFYEAENEPGVDD